MRIVAPTRFLQGTRRVQMLRRMARAQLVRRKPSNAADVRSDQAKDGVSTGAGGLPEA